MTTRIAVLLLALVLTAPTLSAQKVEASFNIGYTASEGITSDERPLLGQIYDTLAVDSGSSTHFTVGVFFGEHWQGEFLWGRQSSRLQADGPVGGELPLSELTVYNYMGNFVYNWGAGDARVRPYAFFGLGATNYSFGDNLLPGGGRNLEGETRFASNLGGGVKFYFVPNVGVRVGARWTPTYITSNSAGIWCDPFYGCWPVSNMQYSNQFDMSGGITFRF